MAITRGDILAFKIVTDTDLSGKGVIGQQDNPGLTAAEMQSKVEEVARYAIEVMNENFGLALTSDEISALIAQAVFETGAADMTKAEFVQPGTSQIKNTSIPTATQSEAEAGTSNIVFMTPLSVKQAISKNKPTRRLASYTYTKIDATNATAAITETIAPGEILEIPSALSMFVEGENETPVTVVNINLSFGTPIDGKENIYQLYLNTGAVVPTITGLSGLKWSTAFTAAASKFYEINVAYGLSAYRAAWSTFV